MSDGTVLQSRARAALFVVGSVGLASMQDAIMKGVSGSLPAYEAVIFRTISSLPLLFTWLLITSSPANLFPPRLLPMLVLRSFILCTAYFGFVLSIATLPLATSVSIYFTMPFFVAALSGWALGERVPSYRWIAIIIGFGGVMLMVRPGSEAFQPAALYALWSAVGYAIGQMIGRHLSLRVEPVVIANWQNEARRIAPNLRVLTLQGGRRAKEFAQIASHDVVFTTYPLLWRDIAVLARQPWHLLILDEAQTVKNAGSRAANALRKLPAAHRLCVTGTPLENHLGELWTHFDFLLPGFLGDSRSFTRMWRRPIEDNGETLRAQVLAQRVRPFILRRRKEDVATELPPKTEVIRRVQLQGEQRALYESVRVAADEQVRNALKRQGFAGSQIAILDASASTHMPDVLEVPYTPHVIGAEKPGVLPHGYILGGKTCMTGDIIGEYSFDAPLKPGDRLVFGDMMQYSFVKNTTFNGTPLPDLGILEADGSYRVVRSFGYEDFRRRLG